MHIRHRVASSMLLLCAALFTSAAGAATFTVNLYLDDADSHDAAPGDGFCSDAFGVCPLRAAIEESNALAGRDLIHFDDTGTIVIATSEGPLPTITDRLVIDGRTAPGYAGGSEDLEDVPPLVYIDGSNVGGADGSAKGLRFIGANAVASNVLAIGIVNFSTGISINNNATNVWIDLCYIGVLADGSAAGNNQGLYIGTDDNYVGRFFGGYGNVISGNLDSGIGIGVGTGNAIAGNRIGTTPNGLSARGNGIGIVMFATGNSIGAFSSSIDNGNLISGNVGAGISGLGGDTTIVANKIGINRNGSSLANGGIGINLAGSGNTIGSTATNGENEIANNTDGIVIDGDNNTIAGNEIGTVTFSQGNSGDGIRIEDGSENTIVGNTVLNSGGDGIDLVGNGTNVQANFIGYVDFALGGIQNFGNDGDGIHVRSIGNIVSSNRVGFSGDDGIDVEATGNFFQSNFVGVTADGENIGNVGDGISLEASDNNVAFNTIAHNALTGVAVLVGDDNTIDANSIYSNGDIGIDLSGDGITPNDAGDPDTGENKRQNYPEIISVSFDRDLLELAVQWRIDSATSNSEYNIFADFYIADSAASGEGKTYLGNSITGAPNTTQLVLFSVPPGTIGGNLVALATDRGGAGSTSEFSPPIAFGVSDTIFKNGFDFKVL